MSRSQKAAKTASPKRDVFPKEIAGQGKDRLWSGIFVAVIVLNVGICTIGQGVSAGTPLYIKEIGGTGTYSGILVAVYVTSAMFARFFSGRMSDVRTRRMVIFLGGGIFILGSVVSMAVALPHVQVLVRILQGLGFASAQTAINAAAADVLPFKRLGEGIGFFGLGQAIAMASGPAFATWLVSLEYVEALSCGLAVVAVGLIVITVFLTYEKHPFRLPEGASYRIRREKEAAQLAAMVNEEGQASGNLATFEAGKAFGASSAPMHRKQGKVRKAFHNALEKAALRGAVPGLFFSATTAVFISYAAMYAQHKGYSNPGLFFAAAAATAILVRLVSSKLIDRFSPLGLFMVPVLAGSGTLLLISLELGEAVYYLSGCGYGICVGIAIPLLSSVAVKASPIDRYGAANALFFLMYDIGFCFGSIAWGLFMDFSGFTAIFIGGIACLLLAFLSARALFPREKT
ncbi:MAG: MFS transporter [Coriobacteriaceae bacterium]|nr:MFS transporter [Coriobacteriaceae bacterium]